MISVVHRNSCTAVSVTRCCHVSLTIETTQLLVTDVFTAAFLLSIHRRTRNTCSVTRVPSHGESRDPLSATCLLSFDPAVLGDIHLIRQEQRYVGVILGR